MLYSLHYECIMQQLLPSYNSACRLVTILWELVVIGMMGPGMNGMQGSPGGHHYMQQVKVELTMTNELLH